MSHCGGPISSTIFMMKTKQAMAMCEVSLGVPSVAIQAASNLSPTIPPSGSSSFVSPQQLCMTGGTVLSPWVVRSPALQL